MEISLELSNIKLKSMVEEQAKWFGMTFNELIWGYINRGLLSDSIGEDTFKKLHSDEYMAVVNDALDVD